VELGGRSLDLEYDEGRKLVFSEIIIVLGLAAPVLFLVFWPIDILFAPEHKWTFLAVRLSTLLALGIPAYLTRYTLSLKQLEILGIFTSTYAGGCITFMMFMLGEKGIHYHSGLVSVSTGALALFRGHQGCFC